MDLHRRETRFFGQVEALVGDTQYLPGTENLAHAKDS